MTRRSLWALRSALAVAQPPVLGPTALRQLRVMAPAGWWRRPPHLPLPAPAYLEFRLRTAYGDDRSPDPADVVTYLHWCRAWPALTAQPLTHGP